jgi:hypothetical protein
MNQPSRCERRLNPGSRQHDAVTIHGAKRLAGNYRGRCHSHHGCLKTHGAQDVRRRKRPALWRLIANVTRREQVRQVKPHGYYNVVDRTAGKAMEQHAPIIKLANGKARPLVLVRRAAGRPCAVASAAYFVQTVEKVLGAHAGHAKTKAWRASTRPMVRAHHRQTKQWPVAPHVQPT